jgi:hypothetical protein
MGTDPSPTFVFCVSGKIHLIYATWCLRSLERFGYPTIEIVVGSNAEKIYFTKNFPDLPCTIISASVGQYPAFSHKPFALVKYLDECGLHFNGPNIVICDTDILWKQDPSPLLSRFAGLCWAHKITAIDPTDFDLPISQVGEADIGIRTILNYQKRYDIGIYPNFLVNAGLFMLPQAIFPTMLENWMDKILRLPPSEMLMSEALMSLTYAEMGLAPISDDVKYFGRHLRKSSNRSILSLEKARPVTNGQYTGYETATHYYGNQRHRLHDDSTAMGLDYDCLGRMVKARVRINRIGQLIKQPSRLVHRISKRLLAKNKDGTILK